MTVSWSHSAMSQFKTCPAQYAAERVYMTAKRSQNDASIWGNRVHEQIERRLREGRPLDPEFQSYERVALEMERIAGHMFVEHEMALAKDKTPCPWEAERMWVRGIADVLIVNGDKAAVIDWKTGKVKQDSPQLRLFALLVFAHFPRVDIVSSIYEWLAHGTRTTEIYRREQIPALWPEFEHDASRLEEAFETGVWAPRPSGLCRGWCSNNMCEYYRERSK